MAQAVCLSQAAHKQEIDILSIENFKIDIKKGHLSKQHTPKHIPALKAAKFEL